VDELIPEEGKDETYNEICHLEISLEAELHKSEKTLGYVTCQRLVDVSF
jgi:hypothetical protein